MLHLKPVERVERYIDGSCDVRCQMSRSEPRNASSSRRGHSGDARIVGGYQHVHYAFDTPYGIQCPYDQRLPGKITDILARNSLGTAASWNESKNLHAVSIIGNGWIRDERRR